MKIKKGDTVEILAGNDKGKKGEVLSVMPKENKIVKSVYNRYNVIKDKIKKDW